MDSNGNLTAELRYKAWGETRYTNGSTPTTYKYTGQKQEATLGGAEGLYFYNARWYDPALGRFIQPDTVLPDPYNPQHWDRYAYVQNNPLHFIDSTGHCTGDPGDNQNPDYNCWQEWYKLEQKYNNVTLDTAFNLWQLVLIGLSLDAVLHAFNNDIIAFQKGLGNFNILYGGTLVDRAVTPPDWNTIILGDSAFIQKGTIASDAVQVIVHEIGHIFDFHNPIGFPYKSDLFVSELTNDYCYEGYVGCLGPGAEPLYKLVEGFPALSLYNPINKQTTPYGLSASIEDFAESFSEYVLRHDGWNTTIPFDQWRETAIAVLIDLAGE